MSVKYNYQFIIILGLTKLVKKKLDHINLGFTHHTLFFWILFSPLHTYILSSMLTSETMQQSRALHCMESCSIQLLYTVFRPL